MRPLTRRAFLGTGALALTGTALAAGMPAWMQTGAEAPVKIGIIGCGTRGGGIARLLKNVPGLQLIACCDTYEPSLTKTMALAAPGAKAYKDHKALLGNKEIEAVITATPLYLHYAMAIDALNAGKHVYLEKSMTYSIPQAIELEKAVKKQKKLLQVGHQYRYYALYHRAKEVIAAGWLGEVTHFECQYHRNSNWRFPVPDPAMERAVNWRMYKEYSGGLMAELCAHQLDMVNYMLDKHPQKVVGMGGIDYWKDGRETWDNVRTIFQYPGGVKATFSSILSNAFRGYSIRVLGTKATLEIQREEAFLYAEGAKKATGVVDGVTGATVSNWSQGDAVPLKFDNKGIDEPTTSALIDFAVCIREGKQPASNVTTGKIAAIGVHMANKAIETGNTQLWKPEYGV